MRRFLAAVALDALGRVASTVELSRPEPAVQDGKVVIGEQPVSLKDGNLVLGKMAQARKAE